MNEALNTSHLSALLNNSPYSEYYNPLELLDSSIPFTEAPKLLFHIPTSNSYLIDLYADDFIRVCLNKVINRYYEVNRCFNIIINTFDLIFK